MANMLLFGKEAQAHVPYVINIIAAITTQIKIDEDKKCKV